MPAAPSRFALATFAAVAVLLVALAAEVALVGAAGGAPDLRPSVAARDGATLATLHVALEPGDTLRVASSALDGPPTASGVSFVMYVLRGGEGAAFLQSGRPAGTPLATIPSTDERWGYHSPFSFSGPEGGDGLDLAWRVTGTGARPPALVVDGTGTGLTEVALGSDAFALQVAVVRAFVAPAERGLAVVQLVSGLAAVAAGVAWARAALRIAERDGAGPLADLTALAVRAGDHLRALRDALAVAGVLLALLGALGALSLREALALAEASKPTPDWREGVELGFGVAYGILVAAWGAAFWRVARAARRWKVRAAEDPFDA